MLYGRADVPHGETRVGCRAKERKKKNKISNGRYYNITYRYRNGKTDHDVATVAVDLVTVLDMSNTPGYTHPLLSTVAIRTINTLVVFIYKYVFIL